MWLAQTSGGDQKACAGEYRETHGGRLGQMILSVGVRQPRVGPDHGPGEGHQQHEKDEAPFLGAQSAIEAKHR